jgi:LL-diaminopimelate aminotransferase
MRHRLNSFYREAVLGDTCSDFLSWATALKQVHGTLPALDFGVADAFLAPPASALAALQGTSADRREHGYALYTHPEFEQACLEYISRLQGGIPSAGLAVVPTAGAKGAINLVTQAFIEPGDIVLATKPAYPIFQLQALRLGGQVIELPLQTDAGCVPDLQQLPAEVRRQATLLYVNYPNNPTGVVWSADAARRLLRQCQDNDILLVNDAAYGSVVFDPSHRTSLLSEPGATDHYLEIHSLSKALQMPGWRLGFLVCAQDLAAQMRRMALLQGSGQPRFLQGAVVQALQDPDFIEASNAVVHRRLRRMAEILRAHGFAAAVPQGTFFLYVPAPRGTAAGLSFETARDCALFLARDLGILTVPWDVDGQPHLRFSVAFPDPDESAVFEQLDTRLGATPFAFASQGLPCRV